MPVSDGKEASDGTPLSSLAVFSLEGRINRLEPLQAKSQEDDLLEHLTVHLVKWLRPVDITYIMFFEFLEPLNYIKLLAESN